jgi:alpha-D-ribose 1-methylphosphonate 5-triphosphate synthase subunit PhnG
MYAKDNASASSVITLTQDTTDIEVAANGGPAIIKWIRTTDTQASVTTTGFDFVVAKDTVRHFVVPVETQTAQGYSSVQGANRENGLYQRLAFKGTGISSVYVTEY